MRAQDLDLRSAFLPMPAAGKRKARIYKLLGVGLWTLLPLLNLGKSFECRANLQACLNSPKSGASSTLMDRRHQGVQKLPSANLLHTQHARST